MLSPHTSPSLRAVARMHARGSYFASPPTSPNASASVHSPNRASYFSTTPSSTTSAGHPSTVRSPVSVSAYGYTVSPRSSPRLAGQTDSPRATPSRRPTLASAIPIGYQQSTTQQAADTRRRPSFKIDLPPRPASTELLADNPIGPAGHTPYADDFAVESETKITPHDERGAGRKLSTGALDMTAMRAEIDNVVYQAHASSPSVPKIRSPVPITTFRNPFAATPVRTTSQQSANFMILTGPSGGIDGGGRVESPVCEHGDPLSAGAGLGYSLNKIRAPTPWARRPEHEGEWLTEEDVARVSPRV